MSEDTTRLLLPLLGTMREGILIVNARMDIILYNAAATSIVRLPAESCAVATEAGSSEPGSAPFNFGNEQRRGNSSGQQLRLIDATRDPSINDAFRKVLDERVPVEIRVELIGRGPRIYRLRVTPLGEGLAAGFFFDITELERLERIRREFFTNLSHELRTPLTAILAYADTLEAGGFDDPQNSKRFIEKLHKHATRMSKLISDISDLSAIESGEIHLALEPIQLRGLVADVIALSEARRRDCF
ncbi:MAG TPA: histidine kinase dimerization/phospho-acceptor domain-containing protein, partial [Blastocatellia bacterium]|nr:histidine kinase dimerization/phospho-acceptor domain-containing protein [Blastocatellia bacterium]